MPKETYEELVMRLRTAIYVNRRMKLGDAAKEIGISRATLYNILNLPLYRPKYATFERLNNFIEYPREIQ